GRGLEPPDGPPESRLAPRFQNVTRARSFSGAKARPALAHYSTRSRAPLRSPRRHLHCPQDQPRRSGTFPGLRHALYFNGPAAELGRVLGTEPPPNLYLIAAPGRLSFFAPSKCPAHR